MQSGRCRVGERKLPIEPAVALHHAGEAQLALPPLVDGRLREVEQRAPRISKRHRPGLRAVVQRVMALIEAAPPEQRRELDPEMNHALAVATVATERMTELDDWISRPDFDAGATEQRRWLQERDMWAARMLELAATLDALVSRQAAAKQAIEGARIDADSRLDELRDRVEALEEVRQL